MLFNSYEFIFAFLPVALMSFFASGVVNMRAATLWLTLASFGFCSWWSIHSPLILLASVAFNLLTGYAIAAARSQKIAKRLLHLGMAAEAADGAAGVPGDPHGKCEVHHVHVGTSENHQYALVVRLILVLQLALSDLQGVADNPRLIGAKSERRPDLLLTVLEGSGLQGGAACGIIRDA